ncbi:Uncharacterized protein QTN25_010395 [Entamoeba marina]
MESIPDSNFMARFNECMRMIRNHTYSLNDVPTPQPKKMDYTNEKFNLCKYDRASVCRDIRARHPNLKHVHCTDKAQPHIPQHTKPLKDFSYQHLLNDIRTEHRLA